MNSDQNYKISADLIRVIAGIMVVAIHVSTMFVNYPPLFKSPDFWIANVLDSASRVAVPLFVMLSGMLLLTPSKKDTTKEFFTKRLKRIAIPMVFWLLFFYFFKIFYFHKHLTPYSFLTDLISLNVYYHLYYLFIIAGLYVITPFLRTYLSAASKRQNIFFLCIMFALSILVVLTNYKFPSSKVTLNAFTYFLFYIPYFVAGHVLEKVQLKKQEMVGAIAGYLLFAALTAVLDFWQIGSKGFNNSYFYDHFSANVVFMSLTLFLILNNLPHFLQISGTMFSRFIKTSSGYIFGIYLVHVLFMVLIDDHIHILNTKNIQSFIWEVMLLKIIIIFVVSYIVVAVGKKIPLIKAVFG
jgi:surface polysaccharide O-acyltransferase-like enzyme